MPDNGLSGFLGGVWDTISGAIEGGGEIIGGVLEGAIRQLPTVVSAIPELYPIFFPPDPQPIIFPQQQSQIMPFPYPYAQPTSAGGRPVAQYMPGAYPGGAPITQASMLPALRNILPYIGAGGAGGAMQGLVEQFLGGGGVSLPRGGLLYRQAPATVRPQPRIMQQNPLNPARIDVWEYAGQPILYSRDIRCTRRVRKIASRARRFR